MPTAAHIAAGLLLALAAPATAQTVDHDLFGAGVPSPVGRVPVGVTIADINGDTSPDVIAANSQSGDLSVLLNRGDGTLAPEFRLQTGVGGPRLATIGDLNGDGHPDIVASLRDGDATIAVLLAESPGVFAPAVHYGPRRSPFAHVMTDLDGDLHPDIAVALGLNVSVFLNAGDGTFPGGDLYAVFNAPVVYSADITAGDVNGDGRPDLIVVNECPLGCDASIAVMINTGDGTFLPPAPLDLGIDHAGAVRAHDLDADGDTDLALVACDFPGSDLVIALNDGAGAFAVHSRSATGRDCAAGSVTAPEGLAIADFNGDGTPDAALTSRNDDSIRVLLNRGDLTFEPALTFAVGDQPVAAAAGDLNADGLPDLATADQGIGSTPTVTVLLNQSDACPPDLNHDQTVDTLDFLLFLGAWAQQDPTADWDGNGTINTLDFLAYLNDWVEGC